jgi:chemotaxis signal transduction protein
MDAVTVADLTLMNGLHESVTRYGFELNGLRLVPAQGVLTELVTEATVFPVPRAADTVAGVLNLHGTIVPVLDPEPLGTAGADLRPGQRRALVFDREEQRIAVLLKGAPKLLHLLPLGHRTRPQGPLARFLTRAWCQTDQPGRHWWEFDHRAAFESLARAMSPLSSASAASAVSGSALTLKVTS